MVQLVSVPQFEKGPRIFTEVIPPLDPTQFKGNLYRPKISVSSLKYLNQNEFPSIFQLFKRLDLPAVLHKDTLKVITTNYSAPARQFSDSGTALAQTFRKRNTKSNARIERKGILILGVMPNVTKPDAEVRVPQVSEGTLGTLGTLGTPGSTTK